MEEFGEDFPEHDAERSSCLAVMDEAHESINADSIEPDMDLTQYDQMDEDDLDREVQQMLARADAQIPRVSSTPAISSKYKYPPSIPHEQCHSEGPNESESIVRSQSISSRNSEWCPNDGGRKTESVHSEQLQQQQLHHEIQHQSLHEIQPSLPEYVQI